MHRYCITMPPAIFYPQIRVHVIAKDNGPKRYACVGDGPLANLVVRRLAPSAFCISLMIRSIQSYFINISFVAML